LGLAAVMGDLPRRDAHLHRQVDELAHALGHALSSLLPGIAELLAVLLDVGAARVGELEDVPAVARLAADQTLVGEQLEGGVHRAGARAPGALGALLDLLHHLVAVARLLVEQEEDGPADVAAAHPPPAAAGIRNAHLEEWALAAEAAGPGAAGAERPGTPHEEFVSSMHITICIRYIGICQEGRVARGAGCASSGRPNVSRRRSGAGTGAFWPCSGSS